MSRSFEESSKHRWLHEALGAAEFMQRQGIPLSRDRAYYLLRDCIKQQDVGCSRRLQCLMVHSGLDSISVLGDHLIRLFASCGSLDEANHTFSMIPKPSEHTWNAIILAHAKSGQSEKALQLFSGTHLLSVKNSRYVYVPVLEACIASLNLNQGRHIHEQIIQTGIESDVILGSMLVDMYAKCGNLEEAKEAFENLSKKDIVAWGAMIAGYAQHGEGYLALKCFREMEDEGIGPNKVIFISMLKACGSIGAMEDGRRIHIQFIKSGINFDIHVGNTLVDMYAKCGNLEEACKIFECLPYRDIVSWNIMIAGYAEHGDNACALKYFEKMQQEGVSSNRATLLNVLQACGNLGAIEQGRKVHKKVSEAALEFDVSIANTLIDMYGKCGRQAEARKVFDNLPSKSVVSWGAMIGAYAQSSNSKHVMCCLKEMQQEGIQPNDVIFIIILSACSRTGLVNEGCQLFKSMKETYGVMPNISHYHCMVELFCHAGLLKEAESLLQAITPNAIGWTSLLTACRKYGSVELGGQSFHEVVKLDPNHAGMYVLMSAIYSDAHMWKDAAKIEELRLQLGVRKKTAKAWIEVNDQVHEFIVGSKSHPQSDEIYAMLKSLNSQMKEEGYVPRIESVLQQMSDQKKEDALCGHCEKLAVAFGFLAMPSGTVIRVTKNLRMCIDCHDATKLISRMGKREIVITDTHCMHHFKGGSCSCCDY